MMMHSRTQIMSRRRWSVEERPTRDQHTIQMRIDAKRIDAQAYILPRMYIAFEWVFFHGSYAARSSSMDIDVNVAVDRPQGIGGLLGLGSSLVIVIVLIAACCLPSEPDIKHVICGQGPERRWPAPYPKTRAKGRRTDYNIILRSPTSSAVTFSALPTAH